MPPRTAAQAGQRARLLEVALLALERDGPEALRARELTTAVGASTQALYTLFGGMPGLLDAIVSEGFTRCGDQVRAVPETDDPVADHFAKGWALWEWALANPQLYRLIFGVTGAELRRHIGLDLDLAEVTSSNAGSRAALDVLVRSLRRVAESGRIDPADPLDLARQFLSATHGLIMLEIAGVFGEPGLGLPTMGALAITMMIGLGDTREAAEGSLLAALSARGVGTDIARSS